MNELNNNKILSSKSKNMTPSHIMLFIPSFAKIINGFKLPLSKLEQNKYYPGYPLFHPPRGIKRKFLRLNDDKISTSRRRYQKNIKPQGIPIQFCLFIQSFYFFRFSYPFCTHTNATESLTIWPKCLLPIVTACF